MAKTEENLSQSKYAEHRNVIKGYIARLIKEGRLHLIKGKLNVEMSDAELDLKLKQDQLVEVDQVGDHLDKIFFRSPTTPISYFKQDRSFGSYRRIS